MNDSKSPRTLEGSAFLPAPGPDAVVADPPVRLWIGLLPECPVEQLNFEGMTFLKVTERLVDDPSNPGQKKRLPQIGMLGHLPVDRVEAFRKEVARTVIRFRNPRELEALRGDGTEGGAKVIGDPVTRPAKGFAIKIPTQADIDNRRAQGRPVKSYVQHPTDEPAARYLFAIPCEDQQNGRPGATYPAPLEVTGLDISAATESAPEDPTADLVG